MLQTGVLCNDLHQHSLLLSLCHYTPTHFLGWHFPSEMTLWSVRYYLAYKLNYHEVEEIIAEQNLGPE
ncbi:hypothetical protein [Photobacterium frigidiphilum]|uniref:hypothetical protein n=1 Tax=Photobacterium frigidiphilum TaxID=264736 RepID=UPI0011B2078B|nr:hypothetical protein [Photobacterium frigidiphilum]